MKIEDRIYGEKNIEEDVLIELINSKPVQRLKNISQSGPQPFFIDKKLLTRYEHSLGVMLLLREHGASLGEQIAGLLHDVPHTAFSHLVDYAFDTEGHDYHDDFLEDIVYDSEIPEILEKHGLSVDYILNENNFGLLEQEAPKLCADRIDYFLRDSKAYGGWEVQKFIDDLAVKNGLFALETPDLAVKYGMKFLEADRNWWANPREAALNEVFAAAIREALSKNIIAEEDLFGTDEEILQILRNSDNEIIQEKLAILEDGFQVETGAENPDLNVEAKARYVDPPVVDGQVLKRASDFSQELTEEIENHKREVRSGYKINING